MFLICFAYEMQARIRWSQAGSQHTLGHAPAGPVASAFGLSTRAVFSWLAKFAEGGQNVLLARLVPGNPPKIGADEMRCIAQAVRDHSLSSSNFVLAWKY